jgi:geranylgeranyl pyrophosphate synthase
VCEAVESFHKASLVHDDIQDGDEMRYDRSTVWKEHGVPVAIAVGDWLVAHGYLLIARSGFARAAQMLEATVSSHLRLCEGQGDDLLGVAGTADYVSMCARKTGEAFALAAQLGALAAGADDEPYRRWGLAYGVLFQINDDIADVGESDELRALKAEWIARLAALSRESGFSFP